MNNLIPILLLFPLLCSCDQPTNTSRQPMAMDNMVGIRLLDQLEFKDQHIVAAMEDYAKINSDRKNTVFLALMEERDYQLSITFITVSHYLAISKDFVPLGTFVLNGKLVVWAGRYKKVLSLDENALKTKLREYVGEAFFHGPPPLIHAPAWRISWNNDSIRVEKAYQLPIDPSYQKMNPLDKKGS